MTFFFNLEALEKESDGNSEEFLKIFEIMVYNKLPESTYIKKVSRSKKGKSYLLNPEPLLKVRKNIDIAYILQYIKLAGRRDYTSYKYYRYKGLHLSYYPDINMSAIKHNPLLKITQTDIFFYFEEAKKEIK